MSYLGDTAAHHASIVAVRLGDALSVTQLALLRCSYVGPEPVTMRVASVAEHDGTDTKGALAKARKALLSERRWQDRQEGRIGGTGAVIDLARFPLARAMVDDSKLDARLVLVTRSEQDKRDGAMAVLAHNRLVAGLRLALARQRLEVVAAVAPAVDRALAALQSRPPAPVQERVPVTEMDAEGDLGLALALGVWAAEHRRPLAPSELQPVSIGDATKRYLQRNW